MKVLTNNQYYSEIANVIREQNGTSNTYKPVQMVNALKDLFYEEVEGVPPISFNGIGEDLLDYRIDGASGGVGDRTGNLFNKNNVVKDVLQDAGQYISGIGCVMFVIDVRNVSVISFQTTVRTERCRSAFSVEYPAIGVPYTINGQNTFMNSDGERNKITRSVPMGANYLGVQVFRNPSNYDESTICNAINSFIACSGNEIGDYEPFGYKLPVVVSGKNLFDEENAVDTDYYITNAGQEVVGANGDKFLKSYINVKPSTQYTFKWSQTIMGSANNTPYIRISEYTSNNTFIQRLLCQCSAQSQNNYTFTTSNNTLYIDIRIDSETSTRGQHITEVMLVKGATAPDTYEEYTATTTNIYLDEPLEENESISMSDTGISIPTINGTNILTVDTEIQPSKVYVKARKESSYENAMRQMYEETKAELDEYKAQYGELGGE